MSAAAPVLKLLRVPGHGALLCRCRPKLVLHQGAKKCYMLHSTVLLRCICACIPACIYNAYIIHITSCTLYINLITYPWPKLNYGCRVGRTQLMPLSVSKRGTTLLAGCRYHAPLCWPWACPLSLCVCRGESFFYGGGGGELGLNAAWELWDVKFQIDCGVWRGVVD